MGSVRADIDQLNALGSTLQGLAGEAASLNTAGAAGSPSTMQSVAEAASISNQLIGGALIPTVKERLSETGEIMVAVAKQYQGRDDANSTMIRDTLVAATGDWNVEDNK